MNYIVDELKNFLDIMIIKMKKNNSFKYDNKYLYNMFFEEYDMFKDDDYSKKIILTLINIQLCRMENEYELKNLNN